MSKNIKVFPSPFIGSVVQEICTNQKVISGEGEFFGEDAIEQYNKLAEIFNLKGSGILYLPKMQPFPALFSKLSVTGKSGPMIISYSFEFVSTSDELTNQLSNDNLIYTPSSGESVISIARKFNSDVKTILKKNQHLSSIFNLQEGVQLNI